MARKKGMPASAASGPEELTPGYTFAGERLTMLVHKHIRPPTPQTGQVQANPLQLPLDCDGKACLPLLGQKSGKLLYQLDQELDGKFLSTFAAKIGQRLRTTHAVEYMLGRAGSVASKGWQSLLSGGESMAGSLFLNN